MGSPQHPWLYTLLAVAANGLVALMGGLLSERWLSRHLAALIGLAAGALLTATFLEILPEALEAFGPASLTWAFVSFLVLAVIEWLSGIHHHLPPGQTHGLRNRRVALPVALLGSDALHNIGDGAAVAAAFLASPRAGLLTAVAVIAHEVPQEVGDYALLRASGYSRLRALAALTVMQLSAVVGAVGVLLAASFIRPLTGAVLSAAAGTFLYISATDLLPEIHAGSGERDRSERMIGFLGGALLIIIASALASALGAE